MGLNPRPFDLNRKMFSIKIKFQRGLLFVLSIIFALAALGKTLELNSFHKYIENNLKTTQGVAWIFLVILLSAEYACALALQIKRYHKFGIFTSVILTYSFLVLEIYWPQWHCPCFGPIATHVPLLASGGLVFKIPLFAISLAAAHLHPLAVTLDDN